MGGGEQGAGRGGEGEHVEENVEKLVESEGGRLVLVGVCVGELRPPRSLPACFMNRMGAKLDAVR